MRALIAVARLKRTRMPRVTIRPGGRGTQRERHDFVGEIVIDNPPMNLFSEALIADTLAHQATKRILRAWRSGGVSAADHVTSRVTQDKPNAGGDDLTRVNSPNRKELAMSPQDKPSIVFCHGIWADGSCFSKVIPPLQAEGYEVIAPQYNLDSAQTDIDSVLRTLGRVSSPSILVGHSYGGAVITGAGIDDRVIGLVYIAAVAPDEDETAASQQAKYPTTDIFASGLEVADERVWMLPSGIKYFCGDLPAAEQQLVWATATPPAAELFNEKPPGTAWRTKPSAFVVATQDHSVHPDLHRDSAKRMGATTYEVDSAHCAMLSHPDVVLDAIRNLVTSVQGTLATA